MITKSKLQALRMDIDAALKAVGEKHGMTLRAGKCTYDDSSCTYKLECTELSADGTTQSLMVLDFRRFCGMFGLKEGDLGKTFASNGRMFRLAGIKPNNTKYPIIGECVSTGRQFKFPQHVASKIS